LDVTNAFEATGPAFKALDPRLGNVDSAGMTSRGRISLPVLLGIAAVFAVSSTIQAYWLSRFDGIDAPSVPHLLLVNSVYWYVPALLAPVIMEVATRFQFGRSRWYVTVLVHVGGALTYSLVHTAAMLATRAALMSTSPANGWWAAARIEYLQQLDWLFMTYLFLVGLAHALVYRRESERRALDSAQLEMRLVEAQLQALQRQLHPHFLFNTLNAIAGLMRSDVDAADRMMDRLGDLLRMTLNTSNIQEVSLKEELEVLQKYLDIEQTRLGDRLSVSMNIDPETLDAQVPNFLLQPLVENAVRHGIAPHVRPGRLSIDAVREPGRLTIRITDSGDGVPPHRLTLLNQGVGLANTRARLEHRYPNDHALVFSNVEGGFTVTVSIPFAMDRAAVEAVRVGAA
jgi:two-component system, LytTR family, sensor kinase